MDGFTFCFIPVGNGGALTKGTIRRVYHLASEQTKSDPDDDVASFRYIRPPGHNNDDDGRWLLFCWSWTYDGISPLLNETNGISIQEQLN